MRIQFLVVSSALVVMAYGTVSALFADNGSSGCDGSVAANGALTCTPNSGCDDGCSQLSYPHDRLIPPKPPGYFAITCNCIDPFFGEEDICSASSLWWGGESPPTFVGVLCISDEGESCDSEDECQILPGTPSQCRCM